MSRSRHLVDPELDGAIDMVPPLVLTDADLPAVRARLGVRPIPDNLDLTVSVETVAAPGPDGAPPVTVLIYRPPQAGKGAPALIQLHGGGYVLGDVGMNDAANRSLAAALGAVIFAVGYRLAPETPFPGAVEDAYAVLTWVHANAASLGVDPARIGLKGESAGGGLAAGLALLARDRGGPLLAFQHLIFPMLDDRSAVSPAIGPYAGEFIWTQKNNAYGWASLLGQPAGGPDVSPYAAAARTSDLAGLPPTYIAVGALDLFLDEDIDYARRLAHAGVPVELHVYPGAFHGFGMVPAATVTQVSERDSLEAMARGFGRYPPIECGR
jgi:acetyl esterase/lipase